MLSKLRSAINNFVKKITIKELSSKDLDKILNELKFVLLRNEVSMEAAEAITTGVKRKLIGVEAERFKDPTPLVKEALKEAMLQILTISEPVDILQVVEQAKQESEPAVILFLGINGTGKTTTMAKVGNFLMKHGYSVVFSASDTFRAGSIEQLESHAKKLGIKVIKQKYGADPSAVAFDAIDHAMAKGINAVLIDTAGRMQNNENLMKELAKIKRVTEPALTIFVGDALAGNDAAIQAKQFAKKIGVDGNILTKLDADVKGGVAFSIAYATRKPIIMIGVGQGYDDLVPFDPKQFVEQVVS